MSELTLQINTAGAWKNMCTFGPERRADILRAVSVFADVLGAGTTWCLLHPDGKREWLREPLSQWAPISDDAPAALEDVMVSVFGPFDDEPTVLMAYRKRDGKFYLSASKEDEVVGYAYAFAPILAVAPRAQVAA